MSTVSVMFNSFYSYLKYLVVIVALDSANGQLASTRIGVMDLSPLFGGPATNIESFVSNGSSPPLNINNRNGTNIFNFVGGSYTFIFEGTAVKEIGSRFGPTDDKSEANLFNEQSANSAEEWCREMDTSVLDSAIDKPVQSGLDEDGYIATPGIGKHKLYMVDRTWAGARKKCVEEDAHLAVINSEAEKTLFISWVNASMNPDFGTWIGAHSLFREEEWVTIQDEPIEKLGHNSWINGYPDGYTVHQCAYLWAEQGGIANQECDSTYWYICEKSLDN